MPACWMASMISARPWPALVISTPEDQSIQQLPIRVPDLEAFGAIPDHGRLALHGARLILTQSLQQRERFRHREVRHNATVFGFDVRNSFRRHAG